MFQVFFIVATVLLLQHYTVVRCRPIPIAEPAVQLPTIHSVQQCKACNTHGTDSAVKNSGDSGITMGYSPGGTGLFRDPVEVLGPLFPSSKSINTCEIMITLQADVASDIRFSERGQQMCSDVCGQYQKIMVVSGPVDVKLMQGYCEYSNSGDTIDKTNLETTCTCLYKVGCNNKTSMVLYLFQANSEGYLKVSMAEQDKSKPIT